MDNQLTLKTRGKIQQVTANRMIEIKRFLATRDTCMQIFKFLETFITCELSYKEFLKEYNKVNNKPLEEYDLKLDMRSIPAVLKYFNFNINKELLKNIFSSHDKEGERSAKKLRDRISHSLHIGSMKEVINRKEGLIADMNCFLEEIKVSKLC